MASHPDLDLVHPPRRDDGLAAPHMAFHGDAPLPFPRPPRPRPSNRFFSDDFRRRGWDREPPNGSPTGGGDDDVDEDDDDDDEVDDEDEEVGDDGDGEVEGLVVGVDLGDKSLPSGSCDNGGSNNNNHNNSSGSVQSGSEKVVGEPGLDLQKDHHPFGSNRSMEKDSSIVFSGSSMRGVHHEQQQRQGPTSNYDTAISISNQDMYYSQMMQNSDGPSLAHKEAGGENGCGFSGRKDVVALFVELGESLKAILSDPITGILMDDAMILPCGHSFGNGGIQHILKIKSCYTCGRSIKEELVAPNLALRTAVQAFRKDEELQSSFRSGKRRKDRCDQENGSYGDSYLVDYSRGKGVQFPFVVTDRVIIKGNKRTPQRFVGREAVVTTQCLNGWYVVKTLDNAESVKLQYRSLAKVPDNLSANGFPNKAIPSNWL